MFGKNPFGSKTLWFNVIALVVALATYVGYGEFEPAAEVGPIAAGIVAVIGVLLPILTPIINMLLRFRSTVAVGFAVGAKNPVLSKTLWFNVIALVVALVTNYGYGEFTPAPEVAAIAGGIVAVIAVLLPILTPIINLVLRFITKEPLKLGK